MHSHTLILPPKLSSPNDQNHMPNIRLTRKSISELPPPSGKQPLIYWDESLPDFGVAVSPNGRKNYIMRFIDQGKKVTKIIAPCGLIDLTKARDAARAYLAALIVLPVYRPEFAPSFQAQPVASYSQSDAPQFHSGAPQFHSDTTPPHPVTSQCHPSFAPSSQNATQPHPTPPPSLPFAAPETHPFPKTNFADFAHRYMERHAKLHKSSWKLDETRLRKYLIPAFGTKNISDITRGMVASLHQEIGMTYPYQANRVREQLSSMIEIAKVWELLPENHPNPTRGIKDFAEHHRKRWLKKTEVEKMISALQQEPCLYIRALFVLYLLTGARKSELMKLRWKDVNLEHGFIKFLTTKNKQIHELPLSAPGILLLKQIPREAGNEFVFPGKRRGQPYVNIDKPWKRIRMRANLLDVQIHDLRHTVGAWLAQDGNSLLLIGKVLNHQSEDATKVYAHLSDSSVKTALEKHGAQIMPMLSTLLVEERFPLNLHDKIYKLKKVLDDRSSTCYNPYIVSDRGYSNGQDSNRSGTGHLPHIARIRYGCDV